MSIFDNETLQCPACGQDIPFTVARSVLADRRPELRDQIIADTFQSMRCPHCEKRVRREPDLNYVDIGRAQWILARPADEVVDWSALEAQALGIYQLGYGELAPMPARELGGAMQVRVVFGWPALREKLLARQEGIDDIALECMKATLMRDVEAPTLGDTVQLRLIATEDESLVMAWIDAAAEDPIDVLTVPRGLLDSIEKSRDDYAELRALFSAGPFVDIDRLLIDSLEAVAEVDEGVAEAS